LRHPTLHRHFGLSKDVGFTNVVAGEMTVEDALLDGGVPNLRVLLSGPPPPNPPELLNSRAGRAVVQRLRELSDFLVVDTPPATIMTDAHVVASMVDGVVVVVAGKQSGRRSLIRSASLLRRTGARIIGVLLNKAEAGYGSEYGYYGYYSERYGKYYQNLDHSLPEAAAEVTAGKES
jgi:capsular exopolysaccharide synthesis family protein